MIEALHVNLHLEVIIAIIKKNTIVEYGHLMKFQ